MRAARLLALAVVVALLAAGCAARAEPTGPRADTYPVRVLDARGDTVEVAAAPRRVLSLDLGASRTLAALGFTTPGAVIDQPADAEVADLAAFAADPAYPVDLVILPVGLPKDRADAIAAAFPGTPVFRWGAPDLDALPGLIARLGLLIGRGPEGIAVADDVAGGLAAAQERARTSGSVLTMVDGGGTFLALGPETDAGRILAAAGAKPIVDTSRLVGFADLRLARPAAWAVAPGVDRKLATLRASSDLRAVPAVQDGRVIALTADDLAIGPGLPGVLDDLITELHAPPAG